MKSTQVTITLDAGLATKVHNLAVIKGESFEYMVARLVEHAEKDMTYRTVRNKQKWQEMKSMKATVEELQRQLSERKGE